MTNISEKPAYISREEKNGITQKLLKELFDYKDGFLYWKKRPHGKKTKGLLAGCLAKLKKTNRYIIGINGKMYYSYRLIFLWHNGCVPIQIDHIDRNSLNDKIENLRAATNQQNSQNTTSVKNSSSKYLGVFKKDKSYKRFSKEFNEIRTYTYPCVYEASIGIDYKGKHLGTFKTEEEAALAYNKAAVKYFGEFANLNIIQSR